MKIGIRSFSLLLMTMMFACNLQGCSMFSGPSDEEVIKAINDTGLFSGGVEKFTLKSPIVVVEKGMFSRDGAWPVKVKLVYTYTMAGGGETKPMERMQTFRIVKSTDSSGNIVWKAISGSP